MTDTGHDTPHPITTHLRNAADNIRSANHAATHGDRREVTELYDTFGALSALLNRLPNSWHTCTASLTEPTPVSGTPLRSPSGRDTQYRRTRHRRGIQQNHHRQQRHRRRLDRHRPSPYSRHRHRSDVTVRP